MKKPILVLLFITFLTTSAYAVNFVDRMLYKKVNLICINRYVLVNRVTGRVEYAIGADGTWTPITPATTRNQYQSMYDAQN